MIAPVKLPEPPDLETRILSLFSEHPTEELQLLDIAAKAHISGRLADLRHAADALVDHGELRLASRHGGRY
ncbi:MAG TPA: hypothetical protein DD490_09470, partial [Acidobacteria bacterium]|nr:hypothetical protein [Acidobacteriota bacterium]